MPSLGGSGTGDGNAIQDSTRPNVASLPLLAGGGVLSKERARTKPPILKDDSERSSLSWGRRVSRSAVAILALIFNIRLCHGR